MYIFSPENIMEMHAQDSPFVHLIYSLNYNERYISVYLFLSLSLAIFTFQRNSLYNSNYDKLQIKFAC